MKKAKLIIVDDEEINADGVTMLVENSGLPVEIVGTFYSSVKAWEFLKHEQVDLVITDIKMPNISGLELTERITERNPFAKVIIFTGVGTLEYAKEAMRYGVRHFLFKPVSPIELQDSILECLHELEASVEGQLLRQKERIEEAIIGEISDQKEGDPFTVLMYEDRYIQQLNPVVEELLVDKELNYTSGSIRGAMAYYFTDPVELDSLFRKMLAMDQQAILFTADEQTLATIKQTFHRGLQSFEWCFYYRKMKLLSLLEYPVQTMSQEKVYQTFEEIKKDVLNNEFSKANADLSALINCCRETGFSVKNLKSQFTCFCQEILSRLHLEQNISLKKIASLVTDATDYLHIYEIFSDLLRIISKKLEEGANSYKISANLNYIIEKNYNNPDLSLRWIAKNILFLNPEYLGKVYVKEVGYKFTTKLLEVRLSKATDLLKEGKKISEVADLIGYGNNPDYFGQLFKKKFSMTPKQYQKKYQD